MKGTSLGGSEAAERRLRSQVTGGSASKPNQPSPETTL